MTQEEKAKAYDKAIGRARELLEIGVKDTRDKRVVLSFFPELKEPEDEEVRKAMIDFFKHEREEGIAVLHYGVNIERMIAWLEKQGEKTPAWSEEDDENIMMIEDRFSDYLEYIREDSSLTKYRKNTLKEEVIGCFNWLKSLKERVGHFDDGYKVGFSAAKHNQWKPSEEQMERLKGIINSLPHQEVLHSLYQDLLKLKG